jgi:hypothetical protein
MPLGPLALQTLNAHVHLVNSQRACIALSLRSIADEIYRCSETWSFYIHGGGGTNPGGLCSGGHGR